MFPYPFSFLSTSDTGLADIDNAFSMEFDGVEDYLDLGTTPVVTGVFSASMWIKRSATVGGDTSQVFIGRDGQTSNRVFNIFITQTTGVLSFWVSSTGSYSATYRCDTSTVINDTNWHHLVFINPGDGLDLQVYIDGSEASYSATGTGRTTLYSTTAIQTRIGADAATGTTYCFLGNIDEVGIFDYALTEPDITEIYDATSSGKTADLSEMSTPPTAWYRMGD